MKNKLCKGINPNSSKVGVSTHRLLEKQIKSCLFENNNSEEHVIEKDIINILDKLFIKVFRMEYGDEWNMAALLKKKSRF